MSFIFSWVLQLFSSGVIKDVTSYLSKRSDNAAETHKTDAQSATQIVVAQMTAEVEARKAQAALSSRHDWIVGSLGAAFVFHIWMIVLDSVFHLNWNISSLPEPMNQWEGQIVLALCCVGPTQTLVHKVVDRVWPK